MPSGGVLFSDGMEDDFLAFNSGVVAELRAARRLGLPASTLEFRIRRLDIDKFQYRRG